ncbi:choice-of-anchor D domain-containing protein [Nocardioides sp. cx-169]|nr:choice-of-anchor D domain-containing protein [Nocardioides sp. cx-169]
MKASVSGGPFSLRSTTCGPSLAPGASCTTSVSFTPDAPGSAAGKLDVSGVHADVVSTDLDGVGVGAAALTVTPHGHDFGPTRVGSKSSPVTLTVTNTGNVATGVPDVTFPAAGSGLDFEIAANTCTQVLAPAETCTVTVTFHPAAVGERSAELVFSSDPGGQVRTTLSGTGTGEANLVVDASTYDFGPTRVGSKSSPVTLTVTNTGNVATGVPDVTFPAAGAGLDFEIAANTCTQVLAPAESCTVTVTFHPAAVGERSAELVFSSEPGGQVRTTLSGTGTGEANLVVDASTHDFEDTLVGSASQPVNIEVTNEGNLASGAPQVTVTAAVLDDFKITANGCTSELAPGASCTVAVAFAPSVAGSRAGSLVVSATPGGSVTADLSGKGLAPAALSLNPQTVAFGPQVIGETPAAQTLTLTNDGDVATGPLTLGLEGGDVEQFAILSEDCEIRLPAGGSCTLEVTFTPTTSGVVSTQLVAGGAAGGEVYATLGGIGQSPAELSISEGAHDFGYADGAPEEYLFTVTNDGEADSGNPVVALSGSPAFAVTTNTCTQPVPGGGICTVGVTYTRSGSTGQSARLSVSAAPGGTVSAALSGLPVALTINPSSHDYGNVLVGESAQQSYTLTNHRLSAVRIDRQTLYNTGIYNLDGSSCFQQVIDAGASCTFTVRFAPTSVGPIAGRIVYYSGSDSAPVELAGTGQGEAVLSVAGALEFGAYSPGSIGTKTLTVTNTGTLATPVAPSVVITGPNADEFDVQGSTCLAPLPGGESCTVTLAFSPSSFGGKSARASFEFGSSDAVAPFTELSGLAAAPGVTLVPEAASDFGLQVVGSRTVKTFRLVNASGSAAEVYQLSWSSPFELDVAGFTCVATSTVFLAPHSSCTIAMVFHPEIPGSYNKSLVAVGEGFQTSTVMSGTAVPAPGARRSSSGAGGLGTTMGLERGKLNGVDY